MASFLCRIKPCILEVAFFALMGVNAVVWINHVITQPSSSCPCLTQGAVAFWHDTRMRKIASKFLQSTFWK